MPVFDRSVPLRPNRAPAYRDRAGQKTQDKKPASCRAHSGEGRIADLDGLSFDRFKFVLERSEHANRGLHDLLCLRLGHADFLHEHVYRRVAILTP